MKNHAKSSDYEIKIKIIRNLTNNKYDKKFYENMVKNYLKLTIEEFILTAIQIFG